MNKNRIKIPKRVSEKVLKEFNHRCALCGNANPQIHHIDEDPSNNDPKNLLPLCPNHHLQDTHAPTEPIDPKRMSLFRRTHDPLILSPKFQPIWKRLRFLRESSEEQTTSWKYSYEDLLLFIKCFKMGEYYAGRILNVLNHPKEYYLVYLKEQKIESDSDQTIDPKDVIDHRATAIEDFCVEMIRYQDWEIINKNNS